MASQKLIRKDGYFCFVLFCLFWRCDKNIIRGSPLKQNLSRSFFLKYKLYTLNHFLCFSWTELMSHVAKDKPPHDLTQNRFIFPSHRVHCGSRLSSPNSASVSVFQLYRLESRLPKSPERDQRAWGSCRMILSTMPGNGLHHFYSHLNAKNLIKYWQPHCRGSWYLYGSLWASG